MFRIKTFSHTFIIVTKLTRQMCTQDAILCLHWHPLASHFPVHCGQISKFSCYKMMKKVKNAVSPRLEITPQLIENEVNVLKIHSKCSLTFNVSFCARIRKDRCLGPRFEFHSGLHCSELEIICRYSFTLTNMLMVLLLYCSTLL